MTIELETSSVQQTMAVAAAIAPHLRPGDVLALRGDLGAGKTSFVRGLATGLGLDAGAVSSPTFVICQLYEGATVTLAHADAYRLASEDEIETIGWEELLESPEVIVAVEWADRIPGSIPPETIDIAMEHGGDDRRRISISMPGDQASRQERIAAGIAAALQPRECPSCGTPVDVSAASFPFCSPRCRMADLGQWFKGAYTIGRPIADDLDD